ncbi:MAG TPA: HEAT repeat domain-containing protein, partial [Pyrinomonadaceae bacterium]|nr:HEAT repeat domain-containing protein [Pyrinomonadaceae bacterium]
TVDETTNAEPPTVESEPRAVEETVVEEDAAAVQEAAAEEVVVEETPVEEIVAEEAAAEEASVEEAVVEEAAAEDEVVEEATVEVAAVETTVGDAAEVEETVVDEAADAEPSIVKPSTEARFAEEAEAADAVADLPVEDVAEDVAEESVEVGAAPTGEVVTAVEAVTSAEAVASPDAETDSTVAADAESVQAETKRLLDGERYDRGVLRSADMMGRQMIAAELLSALAGRNAERRGRARVAFIEHGFFNEAAHDLHYAEAPAERAAAARSLALAGDRAATSHLVAALEDNAIDVRRAAVEALADLRDPAAVGPLEDLRERQKKQREKLPRRTLQNAIEVCREGAAAPPVVAPAAETASVGQAPDANVEAAPVEETVVASEEQRGAAEEETLVEQSVTPVVEDEVDASEPPSAETRVVAAPESEAGMRAEPKEVEPVIEDAAAWFSLVSAGDATAVEETRDEEVFATESPVLETAVEETSVEETFVAEPPVEEAGATDLESYDLPTEVEAKALEPASALGEATEDWIELDVEESSFAPAAPFEADTALTEFADAAAYDAAPVEIEACEPKRPFAGTPHVVPRAGAFGRGEAPPPRAAEEKGIERFDELSTVPKAIQQRITSADTADRAAALADLSRLDPDEAFHHICAAFDDDAREVRNAAARALFDLNPDRADSFTRALREATAERRRHIGAAINNSGLAAEAIGQLTGESRDRTYGAFSLLFLMAKAGEVQPLLRAIESHPNSEVRLAVVKLLALSGQKEILPAFRRLAVRGSLPTEVRSAVMEAIYQISSGQDAHSAA